MIPSSILINLKQKGKKKSIFSSVGKNWNQQFSLKKLKKNPTLVKTQI
jgi:hypothetical protein